MKAYLRLNGVLVLAALFLSGAFNVAHAEAPLKNPGEPRKGWSFREVSLIPMQTGGRIKPLDTFARETVLFLTGSRTFEGWDPVDLLLSILASPEPWQDRHLITVTRGDVKRQLGLEETRSRFSPRELVSLSFLAQYAQSVGAPNAQSVAPNLSGGQTKGDPRADEIKRILNRLGLFRGIISGEAWLVIPTQDTAAPWLSLGSEEARGEIVRAPFTQMMLAYRAGDRETFERAAFNLRAVVEGELPGFGSTGAGAVAGLGDKKRVFAEYYYNHGHPFMWAWIFYLVGALLWMMALVRARASGARAKSVAVAASEATGAGVGEGAKAVVETADAMTASLLGKNWGSVWGWRFILFGLGSHIFGMAMRMFIAGRPPVTNMYESIIWVSFGVVVFALILFARDRKGVLLAVAGVLGALGLIAADSAPAMMDPGIHPLVPVLRSNYWLTIHVLTITLGYAAFALNLGLANVSLWHYLRGRPGFLARTSELNLLAYRADQFGVVLLAAGTILGGVWADYSWGRFWGWDPKETWALIALLGYLAILHARYTGWMGQFGFAAWSVVAFSLVVMAWYGVNFVLGAGLHSYGFSTGGRGPVFIGILLQLMFVAWVSYRYKWSGRKLK